MKIEMPKVREKLEKAEIGLKDTFAAFHMAFEYSSRDFSDLFPYEVFEGLDGLMKRTVHGTRIERFKPRQGLRP